MDGLGGQQEQGKLVTIQVPLPEDVDGILEVVRSVILKGNIQNITIKNGEPITYQRVVNANEEVAPSESTQGFAELSVSDIIHNVPMDEFDLKDYMLEGLNASGILIWMFVAVEMQGLSVTHIVMGGDTKFWGWLGLRQLGKRINKFLGARVEYDEALPPTVFLLCGAKHKSATVAEISYVLKGNAVQAEVKNEGTNEESNRSGVSGQEHIGIDGEVETDRQRLRT